MYIFVILLFCKVYKASAIDSFLCLCLSKVINCQQALTVTYSTGYLQPDIHVVNVSKMNGGQDKIQ